MNDIFEPRRSRFLRTLRFIVPAILPVLLCILFVAVVSRTSSDTISKERKSLTQALEHGAVQTYALTGSYPESLAQLLEECNITYDDRQFVVEYIPNGSNLFPMISVLPLANEKGGVS
ncbi:MAG: hypothetical protein SOY73_02300 [Blautia sp.]|nr:hypothetical protein [Blautia sp.]MDY3997937.1 hypothetical protein [Blautia sp.]